MNKKILIAGGTGLIGTALSAAASQNGWDVTILSRSPGPGTITWDPANRKMDISGNATYDAIVNLAGSPIHEGRWTKTRKEVNYRSRIDSCLTLENYLFDGRLSTPFYLGASGIGIYGDRGNEIVTEKTSIPKSRDWMINTVKDWEAAHQKIAALEIRTVILRTGIVTSKDGGALKELLEKPGIGVLGYFGSGHQYWPWIHIEDLVRMILFCIDQPLINGIFLTVAPNPVTNKEFTKTVDRFISPKRLVVSVPAFMLSLMLGEMHHMLLDSCNASCEKTKKEGFSFKYNRLEEAIGQLMKK